MVEILFKKKDSPQYEVRLALIDVIKIKKIFSFRELSKDMQMDRRMLFSFLNDEKDVQFMTLAKIADYIERNKE